MLSCHVGTINWQIFFRASTQKTYMHINTETLFSHTYIIKPTFLSSLAKPSEGVIFIGVFYFLILAVTSQSKSNSSYTFLRAKPSEPEQLWRGKRSHDKVSGNVGWNLLQWISKRRVRSRCGISHAWRTHWDAGYECFVLGSLSDAEEAWIFSFFPNILQDFLKLLLSTRMCAVK